MSFDKTNPRGIKISNFYSAEIILRLVCVPYYATQLSRYADWCNKYREHSLTWTGVRGRDGGGGNVSNVKLSIFSRRPPPSQQEMRHNEDQASIRATLKFSCRWPSSSLCVMEMGWLIYLMPEYRQHLLGLMFMFSRVPGLADNHSTDPTSWGRAEIEMGWPR